MKTKLLSIILAGNMLLVGQAMATDLLQDEELDRMSAAGDPVVINSEGASGSSVAFLEESNFELNLPKDSQVGLRALTIQNVVGELQLLVNLNVLSASNSVAGTDQRNFSLQSWGSTLPDADTIKTATATASANAACSTQFSCAAQGGAGGAGTGAVGATGGAGGTASPNNNNQVTTPSGGTNTANVDGQTNNANGGVGGNGGSGTGGSANAAANTGIIKGNGAVAASAVVGGTLGSASADVIVVSKSSGGTSTVAFDNNPKYIFNPETGAQHDLSALFISNVVGRAQIAYNLNIAAATLNLIPGSSDPFAQPIGDTTAVIKQVNTGMQFRGTPLVGSSGTTGTFNTSITHTNQ